MHAKNDSVRVKTVYFIPSYIFSHMIVHMLGILNERRAHIRFLSFKLSIFVCAMGVKSVRKGGKKGNDNEPKSIPPTTPFIEDVHR